MVTTTELDGPNARRGSERRDGGGQGMRANRVRSAQRHSKLVRRLRLLLPLGALAIAGYFATTIFNFSDLGRSITRQALPKVLPANLTMNNPRYRGYTKDGGSYVVTAKTAKQDPKVADHILLNEVTGDLTQQNGATMSLASQQGTYDSGTEVITLNEDVRIKTSSGGWARLASASIDTRTQVITSAQPVEFGNPQATIKGRSLKIMQKSKELTVTGQVVAVITAPVAKGAARQDVSAGQPTSATGDANGSGIRPAAEVLNENNAGDNTANTGKPAAGRSERGSFAVMFSGSKGPIEITSERLDLDDINKTATFVGSVVAKQGESNLSTPELRIAYDGAPSGGLTGAGSADKPATPDQSEKATAPARVTSIVAANPVTMTQAPATHLTAQTAAFDASSQRATADGGVVITRAPDQRITGRTASFDDNTKIAYVENDVVVTQGSDRRATATHGQFNSTTDTATLSGDVVLTQGRNILRGQRLFVDQKAGRTELTTPALGGAGPGRITAHFAQEGGKAAAKRPPDDAANSKAGGLVAMSSFRTDPSAPVDVTADTLEVLEQKKLAIFRGNVEAKQGDFKIQTAELNAIYSGVTGIGQGAGSARDASAAVAAANQPAAKLTRLQARGNVVVASRNGQTATGDWSDFDVAANTVTLGGKVVLTQGRNIVKGTRLVIDMGTGESVINTDHSAAPEVSSEKPGSGWQAQQKPDRPSAVFYPRQAIDAARKKGVGQGKGSGGPETSGWNSSTVPPNH